MTKLKVMRKLVLVLILCIGSKSFSQDQTKIEIGANIGLPVGDFDFFSDYGLGFEVNYLFTKGDKFEFGPSIGLTHFTLNFEGPEDAIRSYNILPIAVDARYYILEELSVELDVGYAIGITNVNGGEFYYKPSLAVALGNHLKLNGFYSDAGLYKYAGLGLSYRFNI